jgi:hypothetical protein
MGQGNILSPRQHRGAGWIRGCVGIWSANPGALLRMFREPPARFADLPRIHALASNYNIVGCDDSVSTPVNTDLVPFVDIVVTSLTKMFSGGCNVSAGR